ncbi:MAG: sulfatase [Deltaproteobacteria bacterium]|nr:sulfatase [Deltaproteobacteria bacterium]
MPDPWTRRSSFLAGVAAALFAGAVLGIADTLAALMAQDVPFSSRHLLALFGPIMGLDLLVAFPVGLWVGLVLYGVLGDRPPSIVWERLRSLLAIGPREVETQRLAHLAAAVACAVLAAAGVFGATVLVFGRIVRAVNAGIALVLATGVAVLLALSLQPTLRHAIARLLGLRARLLRRRLGLVSLPSALLGALVLGGIGLAWLIGHRDRFFYGVNMTPVWWIAGYGLALVVGLLLVATPIGVRGLLRLSRPATFALSNVALALAAVLALQLTGEVGAHAGLLDGAGVASRVFSTISELSSRSATVDEKTAPVPAEVQPAVKPVGDQAPDILIISVDALRADHLGLYGHARPTSPNLDALARRALVFDQAYSPAPCTASSFAGILTSRLPSRIPGLTLDKEKYLWPTETPTFVEHLHRAGYRTEGLVPLVPDYLPLIKKGFERYDGYFGSSEHMTDRVIKKLQRPADDPRPLFLWAHYLDVHFPYRSRPDWSHFGDTPIDRYDQEIAYTDSQLARLFAQLQWLGRMDKSIIVIAADHGEAFGEHGTELHGDNLFQEQIHVPLLIAAPGLPRGERFAGRVSLLDLGPTLVELAGVDAISYRTEGASLLARIRGLDSGNPAVLVDGCRIGSQFALVDEHKLYYRRSSGSFSLFDLATDPGERTNLFARAPEIATPLVRQLRHELSLSLR